MWTRCAGAGADIVVSLIDDDQPVTRAALSMDQSLARCVQGDLRTVPLPPRSHDIVLCALLLQRIKHAELVLDRLVAAIKPGGCCCCGSATGTAAEASSTGLCPRWPGAWCGANDGPVGPACTRPVYERLSSARGVQAYALMRELVIAERQALGGLAGALAEPRGFLGRAEADRLALLGSADRRARGACLRPAQAGGQVRQDTLTRPGAPPPRRRRYVFLARARVLSGMARRIDAAWAAGHRSGQCPGRRWT